MKSRTLTYIASTLFGALIFVLPSAAQDGQEQQASAANHNENASQNPQRYSLTILDTLGGCCSDGHGINDAGSVAGNAFTSNNAALHAALWRRGVIVDLGTLGGLNSNTAEEQVVNDRDMVAGFSDTPTPDPNGEDFCFFGTNQVCRPFVWDKGVLTPLPTFGGTNAQANGINARRDVVGVSETPNVDACSPNFLQVEASLWRDGQITELPPLPGDPDAAAYAINEDGEVVGISGCVSGAIHAVLWRHGTAIDLGNLGGEMFNIPGAINNLGQVTGESDLPGDAVHHAFFWDKGEMTDLGTIPGYDLSVGNGINNRGRVVGFGDNGVSQIALIWEEGAATDLNTLIIPNPDWFLAEALSINDRGEITGYAFSNSTGYVQTFVLTPCDNNRNAEGCGGGDEIKSATANPDVVPNLAPIGNARRMLHESSAGQRWRRHAVSVQ